MEVDVLHGVAVNMGLRRGDQVIDRQGVPYDIRGKVEPADKRPDFGDGGMVMVMMVVRLIGTLCGGIGDRRVTVVVVMVMLMVVMMLVLMMMSAVMAVLAFVLVLVSVFFAFHLIVDGDGDVAAGDAALLILSDGQNGYSVKRAVQGVQNRLGLFMQFQQSGRQHIAGGAHAAIQIKCFHIFNTSFILPVR